MALQRNLVEPIDPIEFARVLIRCPSVTPAEGGAIAVLADRLSSLGFDCRQLTYSDRDTPDVTNLFAKLGTGPSFCFAGHTDVVPTGDESTWRHPPFAAVDDGGVLYGRGAVDMKGAIACFVAAVSRFLAKQDGPIDGAVSLLITGDEEGPAINGTVKVLDWLADEGEVLDACLVGEPSSRAELGDMMKIGRRGSVNAWLTVRGKQGHVAYPHLADNPIPRLLAMLRGLTDSPLDSGTEHFQASNLEITNIEVGNETTNVIPAIAKARLNIRFNDLHSGDSLIRWMRDTCAAIGGDFALEARISGESFLTPPGRLSGVVAAAAAAVTGHRPELSTSGGTSDARFIKDHCPVVEFGLPSITMHQVDEAVPLTDLEDLTAIYTGVLERWFAGGWGMLTARHVFDSLYGAYRLARLDANGLRHFDDSVDGFWLSFFAAVLVLPMYLPVVLLQWTADETPAPVPRFVAIEAIAYVIAWVAFPLVMYYVCIPLKRERNYRRYIVAYNWTSVLQNAVYLPVITMAAAGWGIDGGLRLFGDLLLIVILVWSGYVAAKALDIPGVSAFGIIAIDFVVGVLVHGYADVMLAA